LRERAGVGEVMRPGHAGLGLTHGLAGVEGQRRRCGLARVGIELRLGQPQRVLCVQVLVAELPDDLVMLAAPAQAQVGQQPLGAALRPQAIGVEVGDAAAHLETVAQWRLQRQPLLAQAVAAPVHPHFRCARGDRRRIQGHDAARAVAVQRRERPAQHLDALGTGQVEMRDLTLPIGHRGGNAIRIEPQPAHAEGGPGPEAARAELQVLRIVLPLVGHQPGHAHQRLGQVHHRTGFAQRLLVDHGGGKGRVTEAAGRTAAGDDDRVERGVSWGHGRRRRGLGGHGASTQRQEQRGDTGLEEGHGERRWKRSLHARSVHDGSHSRPCHAPFPKAPVHCAPALQIPLQRV
jgi:hypothetical protein